MRFTFLRGARRGVLLSADILMPPIRVLVVDDSAFARKVMREVLTNAGMEVVFY